MAWTGAIVIAGSYHTALGQDLKFDVIDVSYLWPVLTTAEDIEQLISANELWADGSETIWPEQAFKALLDEIPRISVAGTSELRQLEGVEQELAAFDQPLVAIAGDEPRIRLLDTAWRQSRRGDRAALCSALGEVNRFRDGDHAASYLGLL